MQPYLQCSYATLGTTGAETTQLLSALAQERRCRSKQILGRPKNFSPVSPEKLLCNFCLRKVCKATSVTHTKRIYRHLLRKETSFVCYTSSVLIQIVGFCLRILLRSQYVFYT